MEVIAFITAMADARAAIQAASREIRSFARRDGDAEIYTASEACGAMLAVIQTHLAYIARRDSLLVVSGTNAGNRGTLGLLSNVLIAIELGVADYWAIARVFQDLHQELRTSPERMEWDTVTQNIENSSYSVQAKFTSTVAAFGVEVYLFFKSISRQVWSWSVSNIILTESDKDELAEEVRDALSSAQSSYSALSQALAGAKAQVLEKLEEMKG